MWAIRKQPSRYLAEQSRATKTASDVELCHGYDKGGREDGEGADTQNNTDCSINSVLITFVCCTCASDYLLFCPLGLGGGHSDLGSTGFDKE